MKKITIHRALAELKVLNDRIVKAIEGFFPVGMNQKNKDVITPAKKTVEEKTFGSNAQSDWDAVNRLIKNKEVLKKAIVDSNAKVKVKIGEKEMTVADAITMKSQIDLKKALLKRLAGQLNLVQGQINVENERVEANKQKVVEIHYGKDTSKAKPEDVKAIQDNYTEQNTLHLVDPLKIQDKITTLEVEINTFETEVDAVLSESNAITQIEVEI